MTDTSAGGASRQTPVQAESILDAVEEAFGPEPVEPSPARQAPQAPRPSPPSTRDQPPPIRQATPARAGLTSPDPAERRRVLTAVLGGEIATRDVGPLIRVLLEDPDPELRLIAARALARAEPPPRPELIRRGLFDPSDSVRALVVDLLSRAGAAAVSSITPMVGDRAWPLAHQAAMERLAGLVRDSGLPEPELDRLLFAVAALDPPPLPSERPALEELARAIGLERLVLELQGSDTRRLGAARLLTAEGSSFALRALATLGDESSESLRILAQRAAAELDSRRASEGSGTLQAQPDGPSTRAEPDAEEVISTLARTLDDPSPTVRDQAHAALSALRREDVVHLAERLLRSTNEVRGPAAARLVEALGLRECAGALLGRASTAPEEARSAYLRALNALGLTPEELTSLAAAQDAAHRPTAVRLAWETGGRSILPFLVAFLEDSIGAVRMAVLEVFSESGDPAGARLAHELLKSDSSAAVRATAVHVLARTAGDTRLAGLAFALADPDPDVRATAVETLPVRAVIPGTAEGGGSLSAAELLARSLQDQDERVSRAAAARLATLAGDDQLVVWAAVRDTNPSSREELIRQIERQGRTRLAALALANASASDPAERVLAVQLAVRAATTESTAAVVAALEDPDPAVRRIAASAMSSLRSPTAVAALSRSLSDPRADIRVEAVRALGVIDDDAVPSKLITALKDPEVRVREAAVEALVRWRSPAVARRLAEALSSPDLRRAAGDVLERMGLVSVEPLVDLVMKGDPEVRTAAGPLLERIAGPSRFLGDLGSTNPDIRLRSVEVLGAMGGRIAAESLLQALTDPDVRVRARSATLLGSIGDASALPTLKRVFLSDPVVEVAVAAEAALHALGSPPDSDETGTPS